MPEVTVKLSAETNQMIEIYKAKKGIRTKALAVEEFLLEQLE